MSTDAVRALAGRLNDSVAELGALGAALQATARGVALAPSLEAAVDEVLEAMGGKSLIQETDPSALQPIIAEIRATILQAAYLVNPEGPKPGWSHTDPALLSAAGEVSAAFPSGLRKLLPFLEGLKERLESPEACFLDVGVGVGCLSIEMARLWPSLHIVGIDSWAPSIAIARQNVANAGLESRIELRIQAAEDLSDKNTYDLCWIPSAFICADVISTIVGRIYAALRPGGWILFGTLNLGTEPLASALARFRTALMGGSLLGLPDVESTLSRAGFTDIRNLPSPPRSIVLVIAGCRPDGRT